MSRPGEGEFFLSGEFHYFRVPRDAWADRLSKVAAAGLKCVSIYVPWNWHVPEEGRADFTGRDVLERDLRGALDSIWRSGLTCVFRPGPFITAEWRNGGLPDWLLSGYPEILARNASDAPSINGAYPAVTYEHRTFLQHADAWMESVMGVAAQFLSEYGGPIIGIQLDDEPSYFQKLVDPLAIDYNPVLVAPVGRSGDDGFRPSSWALWLEERHGGLAAINEIHRSGYSDLGEVQPPRAPMSSREELPIYMDWLYFKLQQVNVFVEHLYDLVSELAPGVSLSMLYPYLQPLLAGEFSRFAETRHLDLQLTNECYLALNAPNGSGEHKLGAVVACHEAYNMWRGAGQGPAVTMELQGSNATYISPGSMEMLYATTVARGMKGINFFMMIGGRNPAGYENNTGAYYDASAPVAVDGSTRPHYATISKLARVVSAFGPDLLEATPMYDTAIGCWSGYEGAAMAGAAFLYDGWGHQMLANMGDMGLADANSLGALMTLSSVSFRCLDLAREDSLHERSGIDQLWVPALEYMPSLIQQRLERYADAGGHLVILPIVPTLDERARPCLTLWEAVFGRDGGAPEGIAGYGGGWEAFGLVNGRAGESLVAPGAVSALAVPAGAEVVAVRAQDGVPCGFTRRYGRGRITFLGFRLQYSPAADPAQHGFVTSLVEETCGARRASASDVPLVAMECAGSLLGTLCVVNPVDIPASAQLSFADPRSPTIRRPLPAVMDGFRMEGRGGRLLPLAVELGAGRTVRHATWELLERHRHGQGHRLVFSVPPAAGPAGGEIVIEGPEARYSSPDGQIVTEVKLDDGATALVMTSAGPEATLMVGAG